MWVLREQKEAVEEGVGWAAAGRTGGNAVWGDDGAGNGEKSSRLHRVGRSR